ncbi:hypothetical protein EUX98_g6415 [Antrodiella citrinella]|uniref:Uncharacterized protein n=1 Tax=Antrodiella citrinella TaxID=2447956 RepID=A0A4S4MR55_9APHY|nr:hypothetical protein EUX98_g6415 [Antrodiella citrinella]
MEAVGSPSSVFPNEILLLIWENIPVSDLRTHVCFYHICRTTAGFYGDEGQQAAFWRRSCLRAGICFTATDSSYKDVAFEVIKLDGFCGLPACGALAVEHAMQTFGWDPEDDEPFDDIMREALIDQGRTEGSGPLEPIPNSVFEHVAFSSTPVVYADSRVRMPIYFQQSPRSLNGDPVTGQDRRIINGSWHPLVYRSMATFPSSSTLSYTFDRRYEPEGSLDVSSMLRVQTVLKSISNRLDEELSVRELLSLLDDDGPFAVVKPADGKYAGYMLRQFTTLRGLVNHCRFKGLKYEQGYENVQPLPFVLQFARYDEDDDLIL